MNANPPRKTTSVFFWSSRASRSSLFTCLVVALVVAGAMLRLHNVSGQVFVIDEIHLIRASLFTPFPGILYQYRDFDVCLPMAGFARVAMLLSGSLRPEFLRAIPLLSGFALLSFLALRALSAGTRQFEAACWLALVSISPQLIAYSRIARSYLPITFLIVAAVELAARSAERPRRGVLLGLTLATSMSVYFHPVMAPTASVVWAWLLWRSLVRRRTDPSSLRRTLLSATAALLLVLAFAIAGAPHLAEVLAAKHGLGPLRASSLLETAQLLAGTNNPWLAGALYLLAAVGAILALRRGSPAVRLIAILVPTHLLALAVMRPVGIGNPVTMARYLLPLLPWTLGAAGIALGEALTAVASRPRLRIVSLVAAGGALAALVGSGPLASSEAWAGSFAHHLRVLRFTYPLPRVERLSPPSVYRRLGERPGAVLEFPWYPEHLAHTAYNYQRLHGRPTLVSSLEDLFADPRLDLPTMLRPKPEAWLASRARLLVLHRHLGEEERRIGALFDPNLWTAGAGADQVTRYDARVAELEAALRLQWGSPWVEDEEAAVWDLDAVRQRRSASRTGLQAVSGEVKAENTIIE